MLNRIVEMFRGNRAHRPEFAGTEAGAGRSRHNEAFIKLNAVAPLASEIRQSTGQGADDADALQPNKSIVCREAVLGRDQRVAGYAFSLRYEVNQRVRASSTNIQRLYDKVLLRNLQVMEIQRLLEHRLAFVDVSASSLDMPLLEELQPQGIVYVVGTNAQLLARPEACLNGLRRLKGLGYRIGLYGDGVEQPGMTPFIEQADYLFVDMGGNDIPTVKNQVDAIVRQVPSMTLTATNIQTLDEFGVSQRLPFALYQGAFITSREKWEAPRIDAGRVRIVDLLNRLRGEMDIAEVTSLIKQDPALSFKLLRYINSPGMGLVNKIGMLDQALLVLGQQKLYRWLTLLLYTSGNARGLDWAVLENALVRARLAELIAQGSLDPNERDELFVAGVFSLLDIVLGMTMEDVLKQVSLPPQVNEALLHRSGKYAPYLGLAIACEQSDEANVVVLAQAVGLGDKQVNAMHVEAMIWALQVGD